MSTNAEWYAERISKTRCLIEKYEDAISALSSGVLTYMLDTGQSRQTVTKQDVDKLMAALSSLENRLATLEARVCGGSVNVIPGW